MFGNLLGWILALLIAAATIGGLIYIDRIARETTAATGLARSPLFFSSLDLSISPTTVLHAESSGDAATVFSKAIEQYQSDSLTYERFARAGTAEDIEKIPAVQTLLAAAHLPVTNIFAANPAAVINFDSNHPAITALQTLGLCARREGQLIEHDRPAEALKLYEAEFATGAAMVHERLTYSELNAGMTLLAEGTAMIRRSAEISGDEKRSQAASDLDRARMEFVRDHLTPAAAELISVDSTVSESHAGDYFELAQSHADRMWRIEAILAMGRLRFDAQRRGDQRRADELLRSFRNDSDPAIRAAAQAALDLKIEQYRMIH